MNFIMSDGTRSGYRLAGEGGWQEAMIPEDAEIRKVTMYAWNDGDNAFTSIELFDADGNSILKVGQTENRKSKTFELAEDERLIGIKDYDVQGGSTMCYNPRFIIGKLKWQEKNVVYIFEYLCQN